MRGRLFVFVMIAAVASPAFASYATGEGIVVEDVGPYKDSPATLQRMEINERQQTTDPTSEPGAPQPLEAKERDTDRDGVVDADDKCLETPRLAGTYDIGETFALEDMMFRYMGLRGQEAPGGTRVVIHTVNVPATEGGDQVCELIAAEAPRTSCVLSGVPPVEITLQGMLGVKIDIIVRHAVDESGCSPVP